MSNIIPFQFKDAAVRVITDDTGEIWFVARDVAAALGYVNTKQAVIEHCKKSKPLKDIGVSFQDPQQNQSLDMQTKLIPESDVYRLTLRSKLESAEVFQDWIVEEVLPSLRKTGRYSMTNAEPVIHQEPSPVLALQIAESAARMLRMSETSKLRMLTKLGEINGVNTGFLPSYSDDKLTRALGDLLKQHGSDLSARAANLILLELGVIEELERRTTKGGLTKFKSITGYGLTFGKNETSVQNPNETQPRYYVETFAALLALINGYQHHDDAAA